MNVLVRNVDPELWARFRVRAAQERKSMRALLIEIITDYLARQQG